MRTILCMVIYWAFDGDAAFSLLFQRPFHLSTQCFSNHFLTWECFSIAAVVLRMFCKICVCMLDYEYLCVLGMANDWGFFFLVVNFCHLVPNKFGNSWNFLKFLKILYLTNFDFEKTEFVSQTFDITKIETKKKTPAKDSHHN